MDKTKAQVAIDEGIMRVTTETEEIEYIEMHPLLAKQLREMEIMIDGKINGIVVHENPMVAFDLETEKGDMYVRTRLKGE